ncbi:DNA-binding transcriptional regulator [Rubellicoccus peritrichatus]|uniref:DNA-binding transcriptional regulator n=1 Tax=Rubellicoccus peritrichatus TaxID=3080537 RepID=A0AAQ3L8Z7_9BACT|nr:DNA-binding transcriptional regulator [Puniceicoccus sp. CR14]WOO41036.1 DNA-binding transcriptional regulator [Puniceicoccus sp. CR14]
MKDLKKYQIALALLDREIAYHRRKLLGIIDYFSRQIGCFLAYNNELLPFLSLKELEDWNGDGIITEIYTQEEAAFFESLGIPYVNTSTYDISPNAHSVSPNNRMIGRLGAEHLLDSDIDSFAFVGPLHLKVAKSRYIGFAEFLEKKGSACDISLSECITIKDKDLYVPRKTYAPEVFYDAIKQLRKPVGIMASTDKIGISIMIACRQLGLRSPEDVALIGVDNDEIYSHLSFVGMTSIKPNSWEIGYEAAKRLHRLLKGEKVKPERVLIPPGEIVQRDSTDRIRSKYPVIAHALRFIRNHASEDIDVNSVVDLLPASRRWLELKFNEEVGHGISQEIRRVRLEHAKKLFKNKKLSLEKIARETGFNTVERLNFAFEKNCGQSAKEYRSKSSKN